MASCSLDLNPSGHEDSCALVTDPYLDYINKVLMDEAMEDAACLQQVGCTSTSYQAIFSSLQDIIAHSASSREDELLKSTAGGPFSGPLPVLCGHGETSSFQQEIGPLKSTKTGDLSSSFKNKSGKYNLCSSCWGNNGDVVQGLRQLEHEGNDTFKLSSAADDEQISSELDLSFEDLKLDDVYTSLYVEERTSSTVHQHRHIKQKPVMARKAGHSRPEKAQTKLEVAAVSVDVREVLINCAKAVAVGDVKKANEILQEVHQVYGASAHGTGIQRTAYIFSKALAARMKGTGVQEFEAMSADLPSSAEVLRALKWEFKVTPYKKLVHYFANQSILKAAEGASRLHIVDYGLRYGLQWPCLINALADRKGGPPLLVITSVQFPHPGIDVPERLAESGRRLAAYAKTYNVPFQYHAIVTSKWEDLDAASLFCSEAEVLVLNCMKRLHHLADDGADDSSDDDGVAWTNSARQKLLASWHSLNPHLLVTTVVSATLNSSYFVSRFRDALYFYANVFDALDIGMWGDVPERLTVEKSYHYCSIINIVACEGADRVERPEAYKKWHVRFKHAGFEEIPIASTVLAKSKAHVKHHYHKDFLIDSDEKGWMLIVWKGRTVLAMSAWKPCTRM